jgi:E3 ubiquitin-protein ligase SIAH1
MVFLVNMVPAAEPLRHAISLICVQPEVSTDANKSMFGLSLMFSCFTGHHQVLRMEDVMSSLLTDGLPKDVVCFVPRASRDDHAVLSITIDTELAFDDEELEDNDSEGPAWFGC